MALTDLSVARDSQRYIDLERSSVWLSTS